MSLRGPSSFQASTNSQPSADIQAIRARQRLGGDGGDFFGLVNPQRGTATQAPIPPADFEWTWQRTRKDGSLAQIGFKWTPKSWRAGLGMSRGYLVPNHAKMSESDLVTHRNDRVILPWKTNTQSDAQTDFRNVTILHAFYKGRLIVAPYLSTGKVFVEAQDGSGVMEEKALPNSNDSVFGMWPLKVNGGYYLGVAQSGGSGSGIALYDDLEDMSTPPTFIGGTVPSAVIQSQAPGNHLLLKVAGTTMTLASDSFVAVPETQSERPGETNWGTLGYMKLGGRPLRPYFLDGNGQVQLRHETWVASTNDYGKDYQKVQLTLPRVNGAFAVRAGFAAWSGDRMIYYDGEEYELEPFHDEPPTEDYVYWVANAGRVDNDIIAEINELPRFKGTEGKGDNVSRGRSRRCVRRYDFELKAWSTIEPWQIMATDGLFQWIDPTTNGESGYGNNPCPVTDGTLFGVMSPYGAPSMPFSPTSRHYYSYHMSGYYESDFGSNHTIVSPPITWVSKYQEPSAVDPYSLRNGGRDYAAGPLKARSIAAIFPPGYEYADKYFDEVYCGSEFTGDGQKITVRVGEAGRMDVTTPGPLEAVFEKPTGHALSHASRRKPLGHGGNQTSVLFPMVEIELEQGSDTDLTPQGFPVSILGHIDLPELPKRNSWLPFGRSKG